MLIDFYDRYNIFTDASTTGVTRESFCYATASKFYIIKGNDLDHPVSSDTAVMTYRDCAYAELFAIFLGINEAVQIKAAVPDAKFNLFSDNLMGIDTVRKYSEIKNQKEIDNALAKNDCRRFSYCKLKQDISNLINRNNLIINLYHQSAHMNPTTFDGVYECLEKFPRNNFGNTIDYDMAISLCLCNNVVDKGSRFDLKQYINQEYYIPPIFTTNSLRSDVYRMKTPIEKGVDSN